MSSDIIKTILTFGAAGRVQEAVDAYERLARDYQARFYDLELQRRKTNNAIERLVRGKQDAVEALREAARVVTALRVKDRQIAADQLSRLEQDALPTVLATVNAADIVADAAKGAGAGATTALGAWALAGTVGVASTGTAISTLSGAAAFSAKLAWLGGGAVAAGGLGMTGGIVVLGGITILPALAVMAAVSHHRANQQIKEIECAAVDLARSIEGVEAATTVTLALEQRADEITRALRHGVAGLTSTVERVRAILEPSNPLQRLWHWVRRAVTGRTYSRGQLVAVAEVGKNALLLAKLVDQPLVDEEGELT